MTRDDMRQAYLRPFVLTGAGGAALLGVDFGVLAVDDTLHLRLSDDTFLSGPAGTEHRELLPPSFHFLPSSISVHLILFPSPPRCILMFPTSTPSFQSTFPPCIIVAFSFFHLFFFPSFQAACLHPSLPLCYSFPFLFPSLPPFLSPPPLLLPNISFSLPSLTLSFLPSFVLLFHSSRISAFLSHNHVCVVSDLRSEVSTWRLS